MPAPVRYRSTAAAYDDGEADRGTTRARGSRSVRPQFGRPFDRHARPALPALPQ